MDNFAQLINENNNEQRFGYTNTKQSQSCVNCGSQNTEIRQKITTF